MYYCTVLAFFTQLDILHRMTSLERPDSQEYQERRREDVILAEKIGLDIIESLPGIDELRRINFQETNLETTHEAWLKCRKTFDLLRKYYDRFPNKSPYVDRFDEQPYSRFQSWLSDWERQKTYFTNTRDGDFWLQMFQSVPFELLNLLSTEFNLPPTQVMDSAVNEDELLNMIGAPAKDTGITGVRFLPIFRKILGPQKEPSQDDRKMEHVPFVLWNPDDPPEMIRIGRNKNSHYFIGTTRNAYDLEETLKEYITAERVIELPITTSTDLVPVLDVDGTLVQGRHSRDPLSDAAKRLLHFFKSQNKSYGLWSRSDGHRLRWLSEEINKAVGKKPEFMVSFDNWPFLQKNTRLIQPHSPQEIQAAVDELLLSQGLGYDNLGYESAEEMLESLYDIFHAAKVYGEVIVQCKCPRHIPFSPDARSMLTSETETRLLNNQGVLVDDRISTYESVVKLGFNFIHVDSENRVDDAAKFF